MDKQENKNKNPADENLVEEELVFASMERTTRFSLKLVIPILVLFVAPYWIIWASFPLAELTINSSIKLLIYVIPGIVAHELLHALVFAVFAPSGFRSIRFGVMWEYWSPYCHCREPVKVWQYSLAAITPLFILGIVPAIIAILIANPGLLFYGIFFCWAAGGDILSLWLLRKYSANLLVRDHPDELGFIIFSRRERTDS